MDGVLANFCRGYAAILTKQTGMTFPVDDPTFPAEWYWDRAAGTTPEQEAEAWRTIKGDPWFWTRLAPLKGALDFLAWLSDTKHEVYFITDRSGINPQAQTALWLEENGYPGPSVIISRKGKGVVCQALSIEAYLDDKFENVVDVIEKSPETDVRLLDAPYNHLESPYAIKRVYSLDEFKEVLS